MSWAKCYNRGSICGTARVFVRLVPGLMGGITGAEPCPRCGWNPPPTAATVVVNSMGDLRRAVNRAQPGSTILLGDGLYQLDGVTLDIRVRGLVLRGQKGRQSRVLIRGHGMGERMVAIAVSAWGHVGRSDDRTGGLPRRSGPG